MSDEDKILSLAELTEILWCAREARERESPGWQNLWIDALEAIENYLAPWGERPEPLADTLDNISMFISFTREMISDERIGAKAYFWQPPQNRPPKSRTDWTIERAIVVLVAACRERERRIGSGRDAYQAAQAEIRKRGHEIALRRLRSIVSNSSRMPDRERGAAAFAIEALGVDTFDPSILVALCADFIGRQKGSL